MAKVRVNFSVSRPDVERRTEEECKAIRLLYGICITIRTEMGLLQMVRVCSNNPAHLLPMDASNLFIRGVWLHLVHRKIVRQMLDCVTSLGCHLIHVQPRGALSKIGQ